MHALIALSDPLVVGATKNENTNNLTNTPPFATWNKPGYCHMQLIKQILTGFYCTSKPAGDWGRWGWGGREAAEWPRWSGRRGLDEEDVGVADVLAELDVALAVVEAPDGRLRVAFRRLCMISQVFKIVYVISIVWAAPIWRDSSQCAPRRRFRRRRRRIWPNYNAMRGDIARYLSLRAQ